MTSQGVLQTSNNCFIFFPGNFRGQGPVRKTELYKSCRILGIKEGNIMLCKWVLSGFASFGGLGVLFIVNRFQKHVTSGQPPCELGYRFALQQDCRAHRTVRNWYNINIWQLRCQRPSKSRIHIPGIVSFGFQQVTSRLWV